MRSLHGQDKGTRPSSESLREIARRFVDARREGRALATYPGRMPRSLAEAYAIQEAAISLFEKPVIGWKVGRIPASLIAALGTDRLAGPIFEIGHFAERTTATVIDKGFAAVEPEFMLRVGKVPSGPKITNVDAGECIDSVRIGVEIASSPFPEINAHGPFVTISDMGVNHGILLGPQLDCPEAHFSKYVETFVNGGSVGRGKADDMLDGPFGAARFIFELAASGVIRVEPGHWISSGAVSGVHPVRPGDRAHFNFGEPWLSLDVAIDASPMLA